MSKHISITAAAASMAALVMATSVQATMKPHAKLVAKAPQTNQQQPREYDFRGATLGMTLDAFKELPYPDTSARTHAQAFCSGDAQLDDTSGSYGLILSTEEKQVGITKCSYFQSSAEFYSQVGLGSRGTGWMQASIAVGTNGYGTYDAVYFFIRDPKDQTSKLYQITFTTNSNAAQSALGGLVEKFGAPSSRGDDTVQNRMGASFPHTVAIWANPLSTITLESPASDVDHMEMSYAEKRLGDYANIMEREIRGPESSKM